MYCLPYTALEDVDTSHIILTKQYYNSSFLFRLEYPHFQITIPGTNTFMKLQCTQGQGKEQVLIILK